MFADATLIKIIHKESQNSRQSSLLRLNICYSLYRWRSASLGISRLLVEIHGTPISNMQYEHCSSDETTRHDNAEFSHRFAAAPAHSFKRVATRVRTMFNSQGFRVTHGIQPNGESGRSGIQAGKCTGIIWRSASQASRSVNILWPVVPAAIVFTYGCPEWHVAIFVLNYLAMIPCANLIGFVGQEMARKLHRVLGILLETTFGSVVELVLFMVLLVREEYRVIQAAILGSILATKLWCLGLCFFMGGLRHKEQRFNEEISEVGSDLLLTA